MPVPWRLRRDPGGVVEVRPFDADGLASERAMVYVEGDGDVELCSIRTFTSAVAARQSAVRAYPETPMDGEAGGEASVVAV